MNYAAREAWSTRFSWRDEDEEETHDDLITVPQRETSRFWIAAWPCETVGMRACHCAIATRPMKVSARCILKNLGDSRRLSPCRATNVWKVAIFTNGPSLFNIFMADIPISLFINIALLLTLPMIPFYTPQILIHKQHSFTNWTSQWRIALNLQKIQAKIFSLKLISALPSIKLIAEYKFWNLN